MALSDVMLQSLMPKNFFDSDEEVDLWSLSGGDSGSSSVSGDSLGSPSLQYGKDKDFRRFGDYFGLSNLLNNVKISDDNPFSMNSSKNPCYFNKSRRFSWESDVSDHGVVTSPRLENPYQCDDRFAESVDRSSFSEPTFKQLPPPSMRLSKAMRDHIISGAYQTNFPSRSTEKFSPCPESLPPRNSITHISTSNINMSHSLGSPSRSQSGIQVCVFCRNNKESESVYTSHILKDADGRTLCPILRAYTCPICKAHGDDSHTIKYCPENQNNRALTLSGGSNHFGSHAVFTRSTRNQSSRSLHSQMTLPMPAHSASNTSIGATSQIINHSGGKNCP